MDDPCHRPVVATLCAACLESGYLCLDQARQVLQYTPGVVDHGIGLELAGAHVLKGLEPIWCLANGILAPAITIEVHVVADGLMDLLDRPAHGGHARCERPHDALASGRICL